MILDPYCTPLTKIQIKNLNVRPETIKLLEENTEENLLGISLGNDIFGYDNKGRNKQVGVHQTKKLLYTLSLPLLSSSEVEVGVHSRFSSTHYLPPWPRKALVLEVQWTLILFCKRC